MSASPSAFPIPDDWLAAGVVARHETFCPRYGWLKKAVERLAGVPGRAPEPEVFDAPDATAGAFFDRKTRNGADVQPACQLLAAAIAATVGKRTERAIESLFVPGGTVALKGEFAGIRDVEVLAFLLVTPESGTE